MQRFDHWIVTRYNTPMKRSMDKSLDPEWLEHRFEMFRNYCVPSIANQSCQDFRWLLLLNRRTPPKRLEEIRAQSSIRKFEMLALDSGEKKLSEILAANRRSDYLMTSRLDNDDALSRHYVQVVQDAFHFQELQFLEMPFGLLLDAGSGRLYRHTIGSGPFLTLVERHFGNPKTVYCRDHRRVSSVSRLQSISLKPAWMQVVHGRNLANRIPKGIDPEPGRELMALFS